MSELRAVIGAYRQAIERFLDFIDEMARFLDFKFNCSWTVDGRDGSFSTIGRKRFHGKYGGYL